MGHVPRYISDIFQQSVSHLSDTIQLFIVWTIMFYYQYCSCWSNCENSKSFVPQANCNLLYLKWLAIQLPCSGKAWGEKFGEWSVIRQTKTIQISTYNKWSIGWSITSPNFLLPNAQTESIRQTSPHQTPPPAKLSRYTVAIQFSSWPIIGSV